MLYIPFIYFLCLTIVLWRKHGQFEISVFLSALYAFSALASIPTYSLDVRNWNEMIPSIHWLTPIVYCGLLTVTILPFSHLHCEKITHFEEPNLKIFRCFAWVMIFTFFITLINLLPDIKDSFIDGNWKYLRNQIYVYDETKQFTGIRYLMALPETIFSPCAPLCIVFFFYSICFLKEGFVFNLLLLLASTTPIIPAILIAGRTQIIYWFLTFLFSYFLFKNHLSDGKKRITRFLFIIIAALGLFFMTMVTLSRWGQYNTHARDMVLLYMGEPYLFFSYFFEHYQITELHWQRLFPFTHYFILGRDIDLNTYRDIIYNQSGGFDIGIFYTFMGDIMVDIGKMGLFVYILLYNIVVSRFIRPNDDDSYPFYRIIILTLCILVPLEGVFYYSFHTVRMSYFIILSAILCILFKKSNNPQLYENSHINGRFLS